MKRAGNLFDEIIDWNNIAMAAYKAFRHSGSSYRVFEFRNSFLKNINEIRSQLINGSIEIGNYNTFIIYEPKERLISAAPFEQRVLHHAIMNVCHKYFEKNLIYDTYASRPRKGVHKAVKRVQESARKYKYYAKLDIRKFFDSIDHNILKFKLSRLFKDSRLLGIFERIIDSYGHGKGVPIGNLTSQYFANYYLSEVDHYMKEKLKVEVYVRYMDDVVLMSKDKDKLRRLVHSYICFVSEHLGLEVKPPIISRTCFGIAFLGYKVYAKKLLLNGKGKRRYRKNLCKLEGLYSKSKISETEYSNRLLSLLAYIRFADTYKFRQKTLGINTKELQPGESWWQLEQHFEQLPRCES